MTSDILDAHVHLWDPERFEIPWIAGDEVLSRRYDLDQFGSAVAGSNVTALVYVQVEVAVPYALMEAEEVVALAHRDSRIRAIVPWAPLEYGERARPIVERLVSLGPLIRSVRRILQDQEPEFCLQPRFVEGVKLLADYGVGFDLCVRHTQLDAVTRLIDQAPNTRFVLDHLGKPDIRSGQLEPWRAQVTEMARRDNVVCKLSGLVTEADHDRWSLDDLRPFVDVALETFGPSRLMFGGDWPVVLLASPYRRWLHAARQLVGSLTAAEQHAIWWETGASFYGVV
jgi:L-fuconolactonase